MTPRWGYTARWVGNLQNRWSLTYGLGATGERLMEMYARFHAYDGQNSRLEHVMDRLRPQPASDPLSITSI